MSIAALESEGFDVNAALQQLARNEKLYTSVLTKFYGGYQNLPETLETDLQKGDMDKVRRDAHTVKGLAGTIGHTALREAAARLEHSANPATLAECEAALADFARIHAQVVTVLKNTLAL